MNRDQDLIFSSTYSNIKIFIKKNSNLDELIDLDLYIGGFYQTDKSNEFQDKFISEFFSTEAWIDFVESQKRSQTFFKHIPPFDLNTIRNILSFEVLKLVRLDRLDRETDRLNTETLKNDLESAMNSSYLDSIFCKVEGFSNIAEVLVQHNLIKLEE